MKNSLAKILNDYESQGYFFERDQIIYSELFSWYPKRKKIDFVDWDEKIFIEVDGEMHFSPTSKGLLIFQQIQERDKELNDYINRCDFILIRISHDQFDGVNFVSGFHNKLNTVIQNSHNGTVHFIGDSYVSQNNNQ